METSVAISSMLSISPFRYEEIPICELMFKLLPREPFLRSRSMTMTFAGLIAIDAATLRQVKVLPAFGLKEVSIITLLPLLPIIRSRLVLSTL